MADAGSNSNARTETMLIQARQENVADVTTKEGHVVEIDRWASSLAELLEDLPQYMCNPGHRGRISRIPRNILEVDAKSYEPYFLSLGPYHRCHPRVQRMEKRKRIVLKCFLQRKPEITIKDYLNEIKNVEQAARGFYSGVEIESEKFVQMLLLDSLYVVLVLCGLPQSRERLNGTTTSIGRIPDNDDTNEVDQIDEVTGTRNDNDNKEADESTDEMRNADIHVEPRWFWAVFSHDLFLLENQLPFFVLQRIYDLVYDGTKTPLMDIMKHVVSNLLLNYAKLDSERVIPPNEEVHHLLHLAHMFFRPTVQLESTSTEIVESCPMFRLGNTVQLYEAGVHFEARSNSSQHSLLDITFSSGKMVIPCLNVDDNTVSLLRNLIALEQMKYPRLGLNVSAYAVLLLHLITIPEDVALLRRKGIIQHHLSSDKEMMYLVNRLSVGLSFDYVDDQYCLKYVFQELKRYTEHRTPGWRALLRHKYFHNPWTVISLLAASLLLILTFIQTFYVAYPYW